MPLLLPSEVEEIDSVSRNFPLYTFSVGAPRSASGLLPCATIRRPSFHPSDSSSSHAAPRLSMIELSSCLLRPWTPADREALCRHANDREIWLNLRDRFPHPYTERNADAWIELASSRQPFVDFAIEVESETVGGISLMLHDDVERTSAEIGYWLGRRYWGRGIMSEAAGAVTGWGFREFGLTRIYAVPFAHNVGSSRVLERAGYVLEGIMRRSALKDGVVLDQRLYAVTDMDSVQPHI